MSVCVTERERAKTTGWRRPPPTVARGREKHSLSLFGLLAHSHPPPLSLSLSPPLFPSLDSAQTAQPLSLSLSLSVPVSGGRNPVHNDCVLLLVSNVNELANAGSFCNVRTQLLSFDLPFKKKKNLQVQFLCLLILFCTKKEVKISPRFKYFTSLFFKKRKLTQKAIN